MTLDRGDDPASFSQKLRRELARLNGDKYERPNGDIIDYGDEDKYDQVREADRNAIKQYRLDLTDKSHTHQANQVLHLRQISLELDGPILEQSATELNTTLLDMERKRGWNTDPPASRRNHAHSLASLLREHGQAEKADAIKIPSVTVNDYEVDPDNVPTWRDHILPMIEQEPKLRNKALIATAWETASRVTVLAAYKIQHYERKGDSAAYLKTPDVVGTKGADNNVKPLIIARPYIDHWLENSHPCSDDDDAALFCNIRSNSGGEHIHPRTINDRVIGTAAERVDIDPDMRVNPHIMRHSRGTYLRRHPDFDKNDIEHIMDWVDSTDQHKRYIHTTNEENADTILEKQGIDLDDGQTTEPLHSDCPRCGETIPTGARHCMNCGQRLDDKPADWYQYYRRITVDDDPLRKEYDSTVGATPEIHKLSRNEFNHVRKLFYWALMSIDHSETLDRDKLNDRIKASLDFDAIASEDRETVATAFDNYILDNEIVADNYLENTTAYELEGDTERVKELVERYSDE